MNGSYLLDTNIVIALFNGDAEVEAQRSPGRKRGRSCARSLRGALQVQDLGAVARMSGSISRMLERS